MILILGSSHDDILYYETQLKNPIEETLRGKVHVIKGELYGQNVILAYDVYSNYVSSAITSYLIVKYDILLVINVGIGQGIEKEFKKGDIVVSKSILLGDVDLALTSKSSLGEIPNFGKIFHSSQDFANLATEFANRFMIAGFKEGVFISMNKNIQKIGELNDISSGSLVLGASDNIVYDTTSGGVAVSSFHLNVPFISFKVIINNLSPNISTTDKIKALKSFANLGKIVTSIVIEIGRNDTISIDTH